MDHDLNEALNVGTNNSVQLRIITQTYGIKFTTTRNDGKICVIVTFLS